MFPGVIRCNIGQFFELQSLLLFNRIDYLFEFIIIIHLLLRKFNGLVGSVEGAPFILILSFFRVITPSATPFPYSSHLRFDSMGSLFHIPSRFSSLIPSFLLLSLKASLPLITLSYKLCSLSSLELLTSFLYFFHNKETRVVICVEFQLGWSPLSRS